NLLGLDQTGVYAAGLRLCYVVTAIDGAFSMAYYPYVLALREPEQIRKICLVTARVYPLLLMVVAMTMMVTARPLVDVVLGRRGYEEAYQVMGPLLLAFWIAGLRTTFGMGMFIAGRTKRVALSYALAAAVSVPANGVLISIWGIRGAAWAAVCI